MKVHATATPGPAGRRRIPARRARRLRVASRDLIAIRVRDPPQVTPAPTPATLSAFPSGFPTTFSDERPADLPRLSVVEGGLRGHLDGTLVADGLTATYTATWIESRVAAPTITCGGIAYTNVFTVADPTVTSELTFPGWGGGTLLATRRVVVYVSSRDGSSPPACEEQRGGTFTLTFDDGAGPRHPDRDLDGVGRRRRDAGPRTRRHAVGPRPGHAPVGFAAR